MVLAFAAIILSTGVGWASAQVEGVWGLAVGGISSIGMFGLLYFLFDRYLWKITILRGILLVPDLNGRWTCTGQTVIKRGESVSLDWTAEIIITQSWSKLSVVLKKANSSSSRSMAASLYRMPGQGYRLIYHYDNSPDADQSELRRHSGLCDLMFDHESMHAGGQYFTDRDRMTAGTMKLHKEGAAS